MPGKNLKFLWSRTHLYNFKIRSISIRIQQNTRWSQIHKHVQHQEDQKKPWDARIDVKEEIYEHKRVTGFVFAVKKIR